MAKKALVNKANSTPKFKVRGYTRCQRCGRPHSVYKKFGLCRICLRRDGPPRRAPRHHQEQLVTPINTQPIAATSQVRTASGHPDTTTREATGQP